MQFSKWITLGFGALCLVAVAGVLKAQHLYYMAAILLTLPGVSYLLGWYALRGLEFVRELPPIAWEGETGTLGYAVRNRTRFARFFLAIHEPLPPWIALDDAEPPLFNVAGEDVTHVSHPVSYKRRGVYRVQGFDVTAMDPLGVFAFTRHVAADGELVVYPMPRDVGRMPLSGANRFGWQEFMAAALRGSGVDPDGVRPYSPGDPLRRIHWRQTARTGKLAVIEFEEAQAVNLAIALDVYRNTEVGSGTETTLEYAVKLAASVANDALAQGASVRLLLPSDAHGADVEVHSSFHVAGEPGRGEDQLHVILDSLARVEATSETTAASLLHGHMAELTRGVTLLVITADADLELAGVLSTLGCYDSPVTVVYVDPESFANERGRQPSRKTDRFVEQLMAGHVQMFTLKSNPDGNMTPEVMRNAQISTSATN